MVEYTTAVPPQCWPAPPTHLRSFAPPLLLALECPCHHLQPPPHEPPAVLADIGASPHVAMAADAAASLATDAAQASMLALGTWASDRLATVATLDPESYGVMRASLDDVMAAAQGLLDAQAGSLVLGWTNALVLGVQQLMTTVRMAEAGSASGASIESMMAAQQAMAEALQVRNRGSSSSSALNQQRWVVEPHVEPGHGIMQLRCGLCPK